MKNQDFTTTLVVEASPEEVFNAVNNVRGWWSENIEGNTDKLNGEFLYHYQDVHRARFRIIELVPGRKVVWHVLDNYFKFTRDETEWKDTRVIFEISPTNGQTQLKFTHQGLVPEYECFNICRDAWTHYVRDSLKELIVKGKGRPTPGDETEEPSGAGQEGLARQEEAKRLAVAAPAGAASGTASALTSAASATLASTGRPGGASAADTSASTKSIQHRLLIEAPVEKVYEALTTREGLAGWWTPDTIAKPEVGSVCRFAFGPDYFKEMKIRELKPYSKVKWLCLKASEEWIGTTVAFELEPHSRGTSLFFHHDKWKAYTREFAGCSYDWALFLRSLKFLCETGKGLPYPDFRK